MPSLLQCMTAIYTHMSTEYLPTWSILTAAGRATGPEISASRWLNCVRAILHCWRPTCTASNVETPPLVHNATVLTRRQNIWCYNAQHTTRRYGSHGKISTIKATQYAYGASWRGLGRWPIPPTGNERERRYWLSGEFQDIGWLLRSPVSTVSPAGYLTGEEWHRRAAAGGSRAASAGWGMNVEWGFEPHGRAPESTGPTKTHAVF